MGERKKFCDSTKRPINPGSLLSITKNGLTYLARLTGYVDDFGETEPHKWQGASHTPGRISIELIEIPWEPGMKIYGRTNIVDSRDCTIIASDVLFPW